MLKLGLFVHACKVQKKTTLTEKNKYVYESIPHQNKRKYNKKMKST